MKNHMTTKNSQRSALVKRYTEAAQSESTRRSYAQDIKHFKAWGGKIPATAEMVAEYISQGAKENYAVATLQHRLIAIHRTHTDRNLASPIKDGLVKRTMQGIRRTHGVSQRQVRAIVKNDLLEILVCVGNNRPVRATRDKSCLLLGWAGAFRRSEIVSLKVCDLTFTAEGLTVRLKRSKTDQEGEGRTVFVPRSPTPERCPVAALSIWLEIANISEGHVYRGVTKHDTLRRRSCLSPQTVARIVKSAVAASKGLEHAKNVAGHSLRAGWVTHASSVGMTATEIMQVTGHRTLEMVHRYIREADKRRIPSLL
jgi:integrase